VVSFATYAVKGLQISRKIKYLTAKIAKGIGRSLPNSWLPLYYFCAIRMAPVVHCPTGACLLSLSVYGAACRTSPNGEKASNHFGVSHEASLCLLRGPGLCGGPLDLSAATCSDYGSGHTLPFLWPALRACNLGRAAPRCVPVEFRTPGLCLRDFVCGCSEVLRLTFVPALSFLLCFLSTISSGPVPASYQLNAGRCANERNHTLCGTMRWCGAGALARGF
jgi:hypothetical protein